jgi:2-acylglycerol O-acyltransferase 2
LGSPVGPPIDVPKTAAPTDEEIDHYHQLYIDTLKGIYDKYKDDFAQDRRSSIRLVG